MAAVITSISPASGAPGTAIVITGTGFDPGARVACPSLVPTVNTSSTQLGATIPALEGPEQGGGSMVVAVFVQNADSSTSNIVLFTVIFPATALQSWTTIDQVVGEIPQFARGGQIPDKTIQNWMASVSQTVSSCLLRRGLPLDPTLWQQATPGTASPSPAGVLELITRYGAAARLAAAISGQFSSGGEWGLSKNLQAAHAREFGLLEEGCYDKLFLPAAATVESGQLVETGDPIGLRGGGVEQKFFKDKVF